MRRLSLILPFVGLLAVIAVALATADPATAGPPRVVVLEAPPATTATTSARIRFRSTGRRTRCRRDGGAFRPCRRAVRYRDLAPGPHVVAIRARRGARTAVARVRWTVVAPAAGAPGGHAPPPAPPVPAAPAGPRLVFEDDFSGRQLNRMWTPYVSAGYNGNGLRRASALTLDGNGNLVVTAQMIDGQVVSGGMSLGHNAAYGRYEFRVRTEPDPTSTMSGVILTWPSSERWPIEGENNIYETLNTGDRADFFSFVHYGASNRQHYFEHPVSAAEWHTMAFDWRADAIRVYRDGELVWTLTDREAIPDAAHRLCIQLDAMVPRALTQPVRMYVDYVRVYE